MSTAKKIAHGYLGCTKSMLKNGVLNRRGKARYCGRLAVSGSYVADGSECKVRTTVILVRAISGRGLVILLFATACLLPLLG
jgi:hypothetical protein